MKIYISGKITGTTDYMDRFGNKQRELEQKGYEVVNPALIIHCFRNRQRGKNI